MPVPTEGGGQAGGEEVGKHNGAQGEQGLQGSVAPPPQVSQAAGTLPQAGENSAAKSNDYAMAPFSAAGEHSQAQAQSETLPSTQVQSQIPAVAANAQHPPPLPLGWESAVDPASGQEYYIHHASKTTQWQRPAGHEESTQPPQPQHLSQQVPAQMPAASLAQSSHANHQYQTPQMQPQQHQPHLLSRQQPPPTLHPDHQMMQTAGLSAPGVPWMPAAQQLQQQHNVQHHHAQHPPHAQQVWMGMGQAPACINPADLRTQLPGHHSATFPWQT